MLSRLARELKPTAQSIIKWVLQAAHHTDMRHDGTTTAERQELTRLHRHFHQPVMKHDVLYHATARFAREAKAAPPDGCGLIKANWAR